MMRVSKIFENVSVLKCIMYYHIEVTEKTWTKIFGYTLKNKGPLVHRPFGNTVNRTGGAARARAGPWKSCKFMHRASRVSGTFDSLYSRDHH